MDRARSLELQASTNGPRLRPGRTIGVIDVGSNTARFVAFEAAASGTVRAFYETKESPRLGLGTGPDGRLTSAAIERGITAVERFALTVRSLGLARTIAVATSAVQDAPNGAEFVRRVERSTGVQLRIISGAEEARYAYLGIAGAWELDNDLVCDLGGGSLQLADVRAGQLRNSVSVPLGVLRLSQRFFEHDPPKRREIDENPRVCPGDPRFGPRGVRREEIPALRNRRDGPVARPRRDRAARLSGRAGPRLPALGP